MAALLEALALSGYRELPAADHELRQFIRTSLLPILCDKLGTRAAFSFLEDAMNRMSPIEPDEPASTSRPIARIETRSLAPDEVAAVVSVKSRPVTAASSAWVLVEQDRLSRASLARALLGCQCSVRVVDSEADAESLDSVDVAVVDIVHPAAVAIVHALAQGRPDLVVVARACDAAEVDRALTHLGILRLGVCARHATAVELLGIARGLRNRP